MNINDISTQLMYTTVPIYAQNQDKTFSSGTGFIFSVRESDTLSIPLLVTNYHVLENSVAGFLSCILLRMASLQTKVFESSLTVQSYQEISLGTWILLLFLLLPH